MVETGQVILKPIQDNVIQATMPFDSLAVANDHLFNGLRADNYREQMRVAGVIAPGPLEAAKNAALAYADTLVSSYQPVETNTVVDLQDIGWQSAINEGDVSILFKD